MQDKVIYTYVSNSQPKTVELRAPVSESLGRLDKEQFQKFSQYLIAVRNFFISSLHVAFCLFNKIFYGKYRRPFLRPQDKY